MTRRKASAQTLVPEEALERAAAILGPSSAAAQALADIARRREAGEDPICVKEGSTLLVMDARGLMIHESM